MIGQVRRLRQGDEVRTQGSHTLFHCLLHGSVRARGQEACIVDCSSVFQKLLQGEHFAYELHELGDARVTEVCLFALGSVDGELQILQMSLGHGDLSLVEQIVVLGLSWLS